MRLGTVGCLTSLRRVCAGPFTVADVGADPLTLEAAAKRVLPVATLTAAGVEHARAGRRVPPSDLSTTAEGEHAWMTSEGKLVAIGRIEDESGRVVRGFSAR